jgi:hypothetical protein
MPSRERWLSQVKPMGDARIEIEYERVLSPELAARLRTGIWPQDMDDRWAVCLDETGLHMWRSWTGHCIFSLPARQEGESTVVGPLIVNGDRATYQRSGDAEVLRVVAALIDRAVDR